MNLKDLAPAGVAFVVVALVLSLGAQIVTTMGNSCGNSTAAIGETGYCGKQIYGNGTTGLGTLASWLPTIALVIAAAVVIGIVVSYFAFKE